MSVWNDTSGWQGMLDRQHRLFTPLATGAAIGMASRHVVDASAGDMMVWCRHREGMTVEQRPFTGFDSCGVDLLFVSGPGALEAVHAQVDDNPMGAMKLAVREGRMLLYVLRSKRQLLDNGFEDFLEILGLAFMGACR